MVFPGAGSAHMRFEGMFQPPRKLKVAPMQRELVKAMTGETLPVTIRDPGPVPRDPRADREEVRVYRRKKLRQRIERAQDDADSKRFVKQVYGMGRLALGAVPETATGAFATGMVARTPMPIIPKLGLMALLSGGGAWFGDQLEALAEDAIEPGPKSQGRGGPYKGGFPIGGGDSAGRS
jgi:hypothetical protein